MRMRIVLGVVIIGVLMMIGIAAIAEGSSSPLIAMAQGSKSTFTPTATRPKPTPYGQPPSPFPTRTPLVTLQPESPMPPTLTAPVPRTPAPGTGRNEILFVSDRDGVWDIYLMDADGANEQRITVGANAIFPAWSPDGTRLVFTEDLLPQEIWTVNADGSELRNLTNNPETQDRNAAWSPDGTRLVFASDRETAESLDLFLMDPDGSNVEFLVGEDGGQEDYPSWSPDGTIIAYAASIPDQGIYLFNVETRETPQMLVRTVDMYSYPVWSPDGTKIAYTDDINGSYEILVIDARLGAEPVRLTSELDADITPSWSPDGTQIMWASQRDGGSYNIWVMNADGSNQRRLTFSGSGVDPDWSAVRSGVVGFGRTTSTPSAAELTATRAPQNLELTATNIIMEVTATAAQITAMASTVTPTPTPTESASLDPLANLESVLWESPDGVLQIEHPVGWESQEQDNQSLTLPGFQTYFISPPGVPAPSMGILIGRLAPLLATVQLPVNFTPRDVLGALFAQTPGVDPATIRDMQIAGQPGAALRHSPSQVQNPITGGMMEAALELWLTLVDDDLVLMLYFFNPDDDWTRMEPVLTRAAESVRVDAERVREINAAVFGTATAETHVAVPALPTLEPEEFWQAVTLAASYTPLAPVFATSTPTLAQTLPPTLSPTTTPTFTPTTTIDPMAACPMVGRLVIGTDAAFPPFEQFDTVSGEIVGFDIALMDEIAERVGFEPQYRNVPFDSILVDLAAGRYDLVISAVTITDERQQIVSFTHPYFVEGLTIVTRADAAEALRTGDLTGAVVGVVVGSMANEVIGAAGAAEIRDFVTVEEAIAALESSALDALVVDAYVGWSIAQDDATLVTVEPPITTGAYGIAVRRECPNLLGAVDQALVELINDGTYAQLTETYFGIDLTSRLQAIRSFDPR